MHHKFHIPVLGLGFSIDTPLKVAKFGISSVISIVDDELVERMRAYHANRLGLKYQAITKDELDSREKRITAYLNLLHQLVKQEFQQLKAQAFEPGNELCKYFELLPEDSTLKHGYELMQSYPEGPSKLHFQKLLKQQMQPGRIDVNIMSKVDRMNLKSSTEGPLEENSEALAALRGFAKSKLKSSLILSAGMNPKLYSYLAKFPDFFPDENGDIKKQVILKVSDFRSSLIQAKFLAKKGIWVSEFRVESGLNCGGHAFATEGYLLGPILEEFKAKKTEMQAELHELYQNGLKAHHLEIAKPLAQKISVQGGIGTATENEFLRKYFKVDYTGWGSPFLLVPEVTRVDAETREKLAQAQESDFYLSQSSPLGIAFNNFKQATMESERIERIEKGKPGSPCTKKYLCNNTEFTAEPICTASSKYQRLKIKDLKTQDLSPAAYQQAFDQITEKACLCEGLCSSTYQSLGILKKKESKAVAICPGPNLAYFNKQYSLQEMVDHIYGRINLMQDQQRPNFLLKELELYLNYLQNEASQHLQQITEKKQAQLQNFKQQLQEGINYYKKMYQDWSDLCNEKYQQFEKVLYQAENRLQTLL